MADWHVQQGPFDIPDVPDFIPRRLKPYLFIFFVLIIQFSGGVYLAAASDMVGTKAVMQEDILMGRLRLAHRHGYQLRHDVSHQVPFLHPKPIARLWHGTDRSKRDMRLYRKRTSARRNLFRGGMVQDAGDIRM